MGVSYVVRIFISRQGGVADVGLYSAGFSIISTYVGLVFTAMSTDYYPRLSGLAHDNAKAKHLINQQAEISILILGPILAFFLIFINVIVILLYSSKFVPVNGMIQYASIGIYFKAASWSIAYVFLAKGASGLFFWSELLSTVYVLFFNLLGYYFFRLDGMGMSFLLGYTVYLLQVFLIAKIKYKFSFTHEFYYAYILQLAIGISCFFCVKFLLHPWAYAAGIPLIFVSVAFSFHELDKRIGLAGIWHGSKGKLRRK